MNAIEQLAEWQAKKGEKGGDDKDRNAPPRGTPEAAQWITTTLGWGRIGVSLERVGVDGYEPNSGVAIHVSTGRCIRITIAELFSRTRFQAAVGAGLHYSAPLLKQDLLNEIAGAILGLATITEMFSTLDEANAWGTAYLATVQRLPYDDQAQGDARKRWDVLDRMQHEWKVRDLPSPSLVLERLSDKCLLVVRSWFHHEVREHLSGDRGLSAQRIATLMGHAGWQRPAATHWKVATRHPETQKVASLSVYVVASDWSNDMLGEGLE